MNTEQEQKTIQIEPLEETPAPAKKPKKPLSEKKQKALQTARAVKDINFKKRKEQKKQQEAVDIQATLIGRKVLEQGYNYTPNFDPQASLRQAPPIYPMMPSQPGMYYPPYTQGLAPDQSAQLDRLSRVEQLLEQLGGLDTQHNPETRPQSVPAEPPRKVNPYTSYFNRYRK